MHAIDDDADPAVAIFQRSAPGSRPCSGDIAARWVKPRTPHPGRRGSLRRCLQCAQQRRSRRARPAHGWSPAARAPAPASAGSRRYPAMRPAQSPLRPARGTCWHRACPCARRDVRPSRWMPITPGTPCVMASRIAPMASRITATSSLISVGSIAVVPKRRCACAMVRSVATSGVLLNSAPPPPLTCTSMKPGSSQPPPGPPARPRGPAAARHRAAAR